MRDAEDPRIDEKLAQRRETGKVGLGIACTAEELKQKTVEAFDRYIRVTDAGMDAEFVAAVLSSG